MGDLLDIWLLRDSGSMRSYTYTTLICDSTFKLCLGKCGEKPVEAGLDVNMLVEPDLKQASNHCDVDTYILCIVCFDATEYASGLLVALSTPSLEID